MPGVTIGDQHFPSVTWYKDSSLVRLYGLCCVLILSSATVGFDSSMMNGLQSLIYWREFFHPDPSMLGLLNAVFQIGSFLPYFFVPYLADHLGRKRTLICGLSLIFLAVALQSACVNIGMFIAARFLLGFASTLATSPAPLLITEVAHPQHRAIMTTIYNTQYYTGACIAAFATLGTLTIQSNWAWRAPSLLQAFTSVLQAIFIWFVPESPRYLISKNRDTEARAILAKYHAPASGMELVNAEFAEIQATIHLEKSVGKQGWSALWSTKGNLHRFAICIFCGICIDYSGNGLVSQYLSKVLDTVGITNQRTQLAINAGMTTYNLVVAVTFCFFIDKFGRRPIFLFSSIGMLCSYIGWTIASSLFAMHGNQSEATGVVVMIFFFYFCYNAAMSGPIIAYCVEILPYIIRAKGLSVVQISGAISGTIGNYTNPIALANLGWKFYIVYDAWLLCEVVFIFFMFVETKNVPLEEIAKLFDGEKALVGDNAPSHKQDFIPDEDKAEVVHEEHVELREV